MALCAGWNSALGPESDQYHVLDYQGAELSGGGGGEDLQSADGL